MKCIFFVLVAARSSAAGRVMMCRGLPLSDSSTKREYYSRLCNYALLAYIQFIKSSFPATLLSCISYNRFNNMTLYIISKYVFQNQILQQPIHI